MSAESTASSTTSTLIPWCSLFIVIKVWGTALAAWSWWWIFIPYIPVVWYFLTFFGMI